MGLLECLRGDTYFQLINYEDRKNLYRYWSIHGGRKKNIISGGIQCIKDSGFKYTAKLLLKKFAIRGSKVWRSWNYFGIPFGYLQCCSVNGKLWAGKARRNFQIHETKRCYIVCSLAEKDIGTLEDRIQNDAAHELFELPQELKFVPYYKFQGMDEAWAFCAINCISEALLPILKFHPKYLTGSVTEEK